MLWDHGSRGDSAPAITVAATSDEVAETFGRWWKHGKTRRTGHESFDYQRCAVRFLEGWRDSENHVSDFKRRGMPHENGERAAYMAGRFLSSSRRQVQRGAIQASEAAELA